MALEITFWVLGFLVMVWLVQIIFALLVFKMMAGKAEKRIEEFTKTKMRAVASRNTTPSKVKGW